MPQQPLSQKQLALVLRRAAELERRRKSESHDEHGLTERELGELVQEAGLSREDVDHALAELRAGGLATVEPKASLADKLVGPTEAVSERVLRGDAATIERRVADFFKSQLFEIRRDFGDRVQWGAAQGLEARVRRALDFKGRVTLPADAVVESIVTPVEGEGGKVIVRLTLKAEEIRRQDLRVMLAAALGGATVAAVGVAAAAGMPELLTVGAGAMMAGGGAAAVRGRYRRAVAGASETLDRFLDTLQHRDRRGTAP
jgi:hypothetical protein